MVANLFVVCGCSIRLVIRPRASPLAGWGIFAASLGLHAVAIFFLQLPQNKSLRPLSTPSFVTTWVRPEVETRKPRATTKPFEGTEGISESRPATHESSEISSPGGSTATGEILGSSFLNTAYPRISQLLGEEGDVSYAVELQQDHRVAHYTRLESSGFDRLDEAAETSMKATLLSTNTQFPAGTRTIRFRFRLDEVL